MRNQRTALSNPVFERTRFGTAHWAIAVGHHDSVVAPQICARQVRCINLAVANAEVSVDGPPARADVITAKTLLTQNGDLWSREKTEMRASPIR